MAAVERRDPRLIAARAYKTTRRAVWAAEELGDDALAAELSAIAERLSMVQGSTAVRRVSTAPHTPRCA